MYEEPMVSNSLAILVDLFLPQDPLVQEYPKELYHQEHKTLHLNIIKVSGSLTGEPGRPGGPGIPG